MLRRPGHVDELDAAVRRIDPHGSKTRAAWVGRCGGKERLDAVEDRIDEAEEAADRVEAWER